MKLFGLVLVLALLGCGGVESAPRCELGRVQSCPCVGGGQGAQECGPLGVWGACACGGIDAGSDAVGDVVSDASEAGADASADAPVDAVLVDGDPRCNPPSLTVCGSGCHDLSTSNANCGACGRACARGQSCSDGSCACPPGNTVCAGACSDLSTDTANCGACGRACAPLAHASVVCVTGGCAFMCERGYGDCDGDSANGCETNIANGRRDGQSGLFQQNCGACRRNCTDTLVCCAGRCIDRNAPIGGTNCSVLP